MSFLSSNYNYLFMCGFGLRIIFKISTAIMGLKKAITLLISYLLWPLSIREFTLASPQFAIGSLYIEIFLPPKSLYMHKRGLILSWQKKKKKIISWKRSSFVNFVRRWLFVLQYAQTLLCLPCFISEARLNDFKSLKPISHKILKYIVYLILSNEYDSHSPFALIGIWP